jgi:two-component system LytT family response regulator
MKQYRALIIDDETKLSETLELLINQNCPQISICGSVNSAYEARAFLETGKVDFIFLDIAMPGEDGFTFLKSIHNEDYAIIFTTSHHEYAIQAIRACAIDYLLKPINADELIEAVAKAIRNYEIRLSQTGELEVYKESLSNLEHQIHSGNERLSKITVSEQFGFRVINLDDLMYLEADSNYTNLHFGDKKKIVTSRSLGEFEKILVNPEFLRIHKSTIINLNYLKAYSSYEGDFAVLTDGTSLSISRRKLNEFKDIVSNYTKFLT